MRTGVIRPGIAAGLALLATVGCRQSPPAPRPAGDRPRAEIEQRRSALTVLARTGWTASASTTNGSNAAANAIDGNATTRWRANAAQAVGQWFQVDMGGPRTFTEIRMDTTATATEFPRTFKVQVSNNNTSWTTAPVVATGTGTSAVTTVAFAAQTAQFVRVTLTAANAAFWSIYEFNVYGTALSRTGWTATATSASGNNLAANALDGASITHWTCAGAQTGQSFKVDMKARRTFNRVVLDAGLTPADFPLGYAVFVSNDDVNYGSAIATGMGTPAFTVITFPFQNARFIRIDQTATSSNPWSIQELNVEGQPTTEVAQVRAGWGTTASSTSGTNVASNAIDGSTTTRWTSAAPQTNQSFQVDMLTPRIFDQITLDAGTSTNNFPRGYQVDVSNDAATWTTVATGSNSAVLLTITLIPARTARHVRITETAANSNAWSIQEMNVIGPALATAGWVATGSSTSGTDVAANAIDGSATTRWSTSGAQTGQSFTVDMGTAQVFNQLTVDAGTTPTNFPRGYSVAVSSDGVTFGSPIATGTGTSQLVTINFPTQTARAFRISQTATNSTTWSIQELAVWRIGLCDLVTCTASDACHVAGVCDENTGVCSNPNANSGTACDDSTVCNGHETCNATGTCVAGTPLVVDDGNPCTTDACNATTGVSHTPAANGTACDDSTACNGHESCNATGTCVAGTPPVVDDGNPCTTDACNPSTGVSHTPIASGTACDDSTVCNGHESCNATGACVAGTPLAVDDGNPCTTDACNPTTGVSHTPVASGTACDDSTVCNGHESCNATGTCVAGTPPVVDDGTPCTTDACNPTTGVSHTPVANGTACSDGNRCTSGDACQAGICLPGATNTCASTGQPNYATIIDLGSALGRSYASGINNSGAVVGTDGPPEAGIYELGIPGSKGFRWSESEGRVYLPWTGAASYAVDINDAGVMSVTAGVNPNEMFPCRYDPAVDAQPVCQPISGNGAGINAAGTLTGHAYFTGAGLLRMLRLGPGPIEQLPSIDQADPTNMRAKGIAIADDGTVIGIQNIAGSWKAVRYTSSRGTEILEDLLPAGSDWSFWGPNAVGHFAIRPGEIVGWGSHGGHGRAFRLKTSAAGDVTEIVALPVPPTFPSDTPNVISANDSNASHEIAGTVWDPPAFNATGAYVYTDATASVDLNSLIDPQSGWSLNAASAINDNHEVVGFGFHGGGYHAYKLKLPDTSPCPPADSCHMPATRDLLTGVCSSAPKPDGAACDDGNRCTSGDSCHAGTCLPGTSNACTAPDQPRYLAVTDLGSTVGFSNAVYINNNGVVVGADVPPAAGVYQRGYPGSRAFRWSASEGLVYIPWAGAQSYAEAINGAGVLSVSAGINPWELFPCRYDPAVDAQPVCQTTPGFATGINAAGTVTGYVSQPSGMRMFRLDAGSIEILPSATNAANTLDAQGVWIDGDGTVVGIQNVYGTWQAVRYTATRGTEVLSNLLPAGSDWLPVNPANIRSGQIVGWGYHGGHARAFRIRTTATGDVVAIDTIPMPSTFQPDAPNLMAADGMNGAGEIVGTIWDPAISYPQAAYVYTDALQAVDLNTLVDPASGWTLRAAWSVNDSHEVVGFGTHNGVDRAFKLTLPDLSPCLATDSCHAPGVRDPLLGVCSNPVNVDQNAGPFWTARAPLATPRYGAAGIGYGGSTYMFGGCNAPPCGDAVLATSEAFDPGQNTWRARAPMPTARDLAVAETINGVVYVVGGYRGSLSDLPLGAATVEAYDPVHDSWTTRASMHVGRNSPAIGAIGGKLYVSGGHCCADHGPIPPDFVDSYDPVTDTWTARGPVPTERFAPAYGVIGGKLYVAGGLRPDRTLLDTLEAYDPATDSWTSLKRMPAAMEGAGAAVVDGKLFVFGGSTASSSRPNVNFDQVYIYDPATDVWSVGPAMDIARYGTVAAVSGDTVLLAGGYTASGPTTTVEAFKAALRGPICDDGNVCTQSETCSAGSCRPPANQPTILNLPVVSDFGTVDGRDVNAKGQVAGHGVNAAGQFHAYMTGPDGAMVDVWTLLGLTGQSYALSINDAGTIAGGMSAPDGEHAFRYNASTGLDDLGLGGDGSSATDLAAMQGSYGYGINRQGQIAGAFTNGGVLHGFRYTDGIGFEDIGSLAGGMTYAWAINDAGTVGGSSWVPGTPATFDERHYGHAVIFDSHVVGLVDLNNLIDPTLGWTLHVVRDMNGDFAVGTGERNGRLEAFRLRLSTGAIDEISGGWQGDTIAQSVNSAGDVVGVGHPDTAKADMQGFVYSDRFGFKKLNDIVDPAAGWDLRPGQGVGDAGDIVGWGFKEGEVRGYRLHLPAGQAVSCQGRSTCGGGDGDSVCLFSDGVVEISPNHLVALFGHQNAAATSVHPSLNEVRLDGNIITPSPPQPADLQPGTHTGAFLPRFESGHTIAWTVGGETVTASATSPHLQPIPVGNNGLGVVIGGETILLQAGVGADCSNPPFDDGTPCNDHDACTRTDVCAGGYCVGGNRVPCVASDGCHSATCDSTTGQCTEVANAGTCNLGAFDYDKAGRLVRDRGTELVYDAYDQLREVRPTASPPAFTNLAVDDLKTPGDGETQALVGHANSKGHVPVEVSLAAGGYRTLLFEGNGAPVDLTAAAGMGTSVFGNSMNDADAVAGTWSPGGTNHAFRYDQGGFHDLGNAGDFTVAYDINNLNEVTGYFSVGGNAHGYLHSDATSFREIGTLGGAQSWGWRVDDLGRVAASAQKADSPSSGIARFGHAALYQDIVGLQDLDAQYGDPLSGRTLAIANETQGDWVVGIATQGTQSRAYRLNLSTGAIDDIGWAGSSFGYSVNSAGDAVGWGYFDAGETIQAAWILSARTGFARLNDLIDPASGWDLRTAGSIDDLGDVVGWGYHNGRVSAYRLRVPAHASGTGSPMVAEKHTYGYDGLRTSTTTAPGTTSASVQFWFTQDYTQRTGVREHYLRVGDRLIARVTTQPNPNGMGTVAAAPDRAARSTQPVLAFLLILAALAGIAFGIAKRRRRWVPGLAGLASLVLGAASCEMLGLNRSSGALDWSVATNLTHFFHQGIAPGPTLITNSTGALEEERRYEPFGQPIPTVNVAAEPQNILGKLTDPNTGWSYHGARWMQPQTARWTAPDPAVKGPDPRQMLDPWTLNPYVYAGQNPARQWDPDGEADLPITNERHAEVVRHWLDTRWFWFTTHEPNVQDLMAHEKEMEAEGLLEPRDRSIDKFTMSDGVAVAIEWAEREYLINMATGYGARAFTEVGRLGWWFAKAGRYTLFDERARFIVKFMMSKGVSMVNSFKYLRGFDLTRPIATRLIPKGSIVIQYVTKGREAGRWFAPLKSVAEKLGLYKPGEAVTRELRYFKATRDVEVLEGTASNMEGTVGGDVQYFSEPDAFEAIHTETGSTPLPGMTQ